mgnify:CR=1 FL=1
MFRASNVGSKDAQRARNHRFQPSIRSILFPLLDRPFRTSQRITWGQPVPRSRVAPFVLGKPQRSSLAFSMNARHAIVALSWPRFVTVLRFRCFLIFIGQRSCTTCATNRFVSTYKLVMAGGRAANKHRLPPSYRRKRATFVAVTLHR